MREPVFHEREEAVPAGQVLGLALVVRQQAEGIVEADGPEVLELRRSSPVLTIPSVGASGRHRHCIGSRSRMDAVGGLGSTPWARSCWRLRSRRVVVTAREPDGRWGRSTTNDRPAWMHRRQFGGHFPGLDRAVESLQLEVASLGDETPLLEPGRDPPIGLAAEQGLTAACCAWSRAARLVGVPMALTLPPAIRAPTTAGPTAIPPPTLKPPAEALSRMPMAARSAAEAWSSLGRDHVEGGHHRIASELVHQTTLGLDLGAGPAVEGRHPRGQRLRDGVAGKGRVTADVDEEDGHQALFWRD